MIQEVLPAILWLRAKALLKLREQVLSHVVEDDILIEDLDEHGHLVDGGDVVE